MPAKTSDDPRDVCNHQPVPVSRDLKEPADRKPTRWRCRWCGCTVDPITRKVIRKAA